MHCLFIVLSCPSRNRLQKTTVAFVHFKNNSRALLCASKITNISDVKCMLKKYFYVFHIILKCHERRIFFHQMIHWDFLIFFQSFSRGVLFGIVFIFYLFFHFFFYFYLLIHLFILFFGAKCMIQEFLLLEEKLKTNWISKGKYFTSFNKIKICQLLKFFLYIYSYRKNSNIKAKRW